MDIYLFNVKNIPPHISSGRTYCLKEDGALVYLKSTEVLTSIAETERAYKLYGQKVRVITHPPVGMEQEGSALDEAQCLQFGIQPDKSLLERILDRVLGERGNPIHNID